MKILHILSADKFGKPYIDFVNKKFNPEQHKFALVGSTNESNLNTQHSNIFTIHNKSTSILLLIRNMYRADKIILHSLFHRIAIYLFFLNPWLLIKVYWVVWGGDLYAYRNQQKNFKSKVKGFFYSFVTKRFGHIVTLVKDDYKLAKKWYNVKGQYHHGAYVLPTPKSHLNSKASNFNRKENNQIIIQIGNSADPGNQHIEALKKLLPLRDKDILIYSPLSYGNKSYRDKVIGEGHRLFNNKFIPLTEFLSPEDYADYLMNIDIAIFNNNRQQALGNIYALLYLNKKVYIRSDTTMWTHFKEKFDIEMNDFLSIENISEQQFLETGVTQNRDKIKKVFDEEYLVSIWEPIFTERI